MSVRTRNFLSVVHAVAIRKGWDPERIQRNQVAAITEYINAAYRLCHGYFDWPEAMRTDAMTVTVGAVPWTAGPARPELDMVRKVYAEDPDTEECPRVACWRLGPDGISLLGDDRALTEVWVEYRPETPVFTSEPWSASRAYQYGGIYSAAFNPADGECYRCLSETPVIGTGVADAGVWQRLPLLKILALATIAHAFGSSLEEEDQFGKAQLKRAEAEGLLEHEALILRHQSGQRKQYQS